MRVRAWQVQRGGGIGTLRDTTRSLPPLGDFDVCVQVRAVALNARDLHNADSGEGVLVPASDGAGVVAAVGARVTRWRVGDRVAAAFYPRWLDGVPTDDKVVGSLGGGADGVLAEAIVAHEDGLFAIPAHLDFIEAATLPTAGLTSWHALFEVTSLPSGNTVLLLGTGGVSTWALTFARSARLRTILTSSDDGKLERARALGADETINYRTHPDWDREVLRLTDQRGADLVVEVGGEGTLARSIRAVGAGRTVAMVGGVSGGFGAQLEPFALIGGAKRLAGVLVGSRRMAEAMVRFVEDRGLRPVIDRVFPFEQAPAAFAHLASGSHFGKVAISIGSPGSSPARG